MVLSFGDRGTHTPAGPRSIPGRSPVGPASPTIDELVRDLRFLRARGLFRVRQLSLPALAAAAQAAGLDPQSRAAPQPIETLLRTAIRPLGDEGPGRAAQYLFGLVQGTVGRSPTELRARAAMVFDRSPETFRKDRERQIIERIAEEILRLTEPSPEPRSAGGPHVCDSEETDDETDDETDAPAGQLRAQLRQEIQQLLVDDHGPIRQPTDPVRAEAPNEGRIIGPLLIPVRRDPLPLTVHVGEAELLRDVDIVVTSANVHLDPSRFYATTLLGRLRSAACRRDDTGTVLEDVVADELRAWVRDAGGPDRPVPAGVVAPTSSGALRHRRIRRLYHAAVAVPVTSSNDYLVSGPAIARAVRRCFELARGERTIYDPPLASLCFPLFGAGRARLDPAVSFSWIWPVIVEETTADPTWEVHLSVWCAAEAVAVLSQLLRILNPPSHREDHDS